MKVILLVAFKRDFIHQESNKNFVKIKSKLSTGVEAVLEFKGT